MRRTLPLLAALALAACETSVVVDTPDFSPELVLYSFPSPDSVWTAGVARTLPLGAQVDTFAVENATVLLYENGALVDTLRLARAPSPDEPYLLFTPAEYRSARGLRPVPGRAYRLEATAPGYDVVAGELTLPSPPEINVAQEAREPNPDDPYCETVPLHVTLADPPGDDVYELGVQVTDSYDGGVGYSYLIPFETASPSFRSGYDELDSDVTLGEDQEFYRAMFRDDLFQGQRETFNLDVRVCTYEGGEIQLSLVVARVSPDFARYAVATRRQDLNAENPFAEPSPLFSNVTGGQGVVAGFATTRVVLASPD